ncbi:uncharacterized protein ACIB01_005292 [Guaruba guarouba]
MDAEEAEIEALHCLYDHLRQQEAQLEANKSDRAELEELRSELLVQQQEGQESIVTMLEDLRGQVSSLQSLARDLEQEKGKLTSMLQELKQELKTQAEQQEVTRATVEQLVTTSQQLQEQQDQEVLSRLAVQEQQLQQVQEQLREEMASKLDRTELERFRQQLEEQWKRSLKQLQEKAPPREADNAAGIKKQLSSADSRCLPCDRQLSMRVPGSPVVPIPPTPPLIPRSAEKTPRMLNPGESKREQAAGCQYPSVPRQCRGQSTVLQPVPPSTPRSLKTSTAFCSKVGMKTEGIQRGQLWLGV